MLATGGSACKAIKVLLDNGVSEENIIFVNVMSSRQGARILRERFPRLTLVIAAIDNELSSSG
jgi:uracil phosphoribosyltransferase